MDALSHDIRQIARDIYPHYDQIEPLGHGGMGDLFKGRKTGLNVPVVIKVIKTNLKGRLDERQEAEILKGLKHKYLPRIYDVIENKDGYVYTIMDYIPGDNLKDYVKRVGALDQKTVYRWAQQLCEVVEYLHSQTPAIIHSDIKPGNVMITPDGDICLIDFNTSMEYQAGLTAIGKTKGYAAPEQYTKPEQVLKGMQVSAGLASQIDEKTILTPERESDETVFVEESKVSRTGTNTKPPDMGGRSSVASRLLRGSALSTAVTNSDKQVYYGTLTKQTDVYAVGATLYFALTGKTPPHALETAKPLSTFRLPVSKSLVQIIERAMEKNPKDRFLDTGEMGRALRDIHRLDGNYRKVRLLTAVGVLLELVLLLGGIALIGIGSVRLEQEQFNAYVQLLDDAQLEKNRGNFQQALELTWQAQLLIDTRMEAYAEEAAVYFSKGIAAISEEERNEFFKSCVTTVQEALMAELVGGTAAEWSKLYFVGAESCVELENYSLAQKWYCRANEFAPTESSYRGLICACAFDGQMDAAKAALEDMRAELPEVDTEASFELIQAELCYLQNDYSGAIKHYKKLFQVTNDETLLRRTYLAANNACVYGGNRFLLQGIDFLEEACERLPSAWGIYKPLLANSYYTQANLAEEDQQKAWLEKALAAYESVEAKYISVEERLTMNKIRIILKKFETAEEDLLSMKELYPTHYRIYMCLADLYVSKCADSKDMRYLEKAVNAAREAKMYYEISGAYDAEIIKFLETWQQMGYSI